MKTINVPKDFSCFPGLRYKRSTDHSGEEFRDEILIPALNGGDNQVTIELDGTIGYWSSFLEEAFGGAVRKGHVLNQDTLVLVSEDNRLKQKIWNFINNASHSS